MINKMEKEFIRVRSVKDIVVSSSLVIAGSVLLALPTNEAINIAGFFMIMTGILLAFVMKTAYMDTVTKEKFQKKEFFFQHAMYASLSSAVASKPESVDLTEADKGNSLRLDVYVCRSSGKAYLQLFEYVPYKYEPCSQIHEHAIDRVEKLLKQ